MIRLIFVINNLRIGGAQKSLMALLASLNYKIVSVDLVVVDQDGININEIPKNVNLLPQNFIYKCYIVSEFSSLKNLIYSKRYILAIWKIFAKLFGLIKSLVVYKFSYKFAIQYSWDFYKIFLPQIKGKYQCSFGLGSVSTYISVDKIESRKKVAWVHTDYKTYCKTHNIQPYLDNRYFKKLSNLLVVTNNNKKALEEVFPYLSAKIEVVENIIQSDHIKVLSNESIDDTRFKNDILTIVTVARIEKAKALDRIPEVIYKLKNEGLRFKWYIVGDGDRKSVEEEIDKYGISDDCIILGYKSNPYPYIKLCDIFALPSLYEGKAITLEEAKVLGKAIITTNYPSAKDSIEHNVNGLIVDNSKLGIYKGVKELLKDKYLRKRLSGQLKKNIRSDNLAIAKIMDIIQK